MNNKEKFKLINDHREAVGRPKFKKLSYDEIKLNLDLINRKAPLGVDPWEYSMTARIETWYDKSFREDTYGDYDGVKVYINDVLEIEYGDEYDDKGEHKADAFIEGWAAVKGIHYMDIEIIRESVLC